MWPLHLPLFQRAETSVKILVGRIASYQHDAIYPLFACRSWKAVYRYPDLLLSPQFFCNFGLEGTGTVLSSHCPVSLQSFNLLILLQKNSPSEVCYPRTVQSVYNNLIF